VRDDNLADVVTRAEVLEGLADLFVGECLDRMDELEVLLLE
jgi:hypothetical protein